MNPRISEFFGIEIFLYWNDHNPPHFHVKYADHNAYVSIQDPHIIEWSLPKKIEKLVLAWAELYNEALLEDWELVQLLKTPKRIDPLTR